MDTAYVCSWKCHGFRSADVWFVAGLYHDLGWLRASQAIWCMPGVSMWWIVFPYLECTMPLKLADSSKRRSLSLEMSLDDGPQLGLICPIQWYAWIGNIESNGRGGGVACHIRNYINYNRLGDMEDSGVASHSRALRQYLIWCPCLAVG